MIHLSGMDAAFLHLETPEMPMHAGSLLADFIVEEHHKRRALTVARDPAAASR